MRQLWAVWFTAGAMAFLELIALYPLKASESKARSADSLESTLRVNNERHSPSDLEVGGEPAGLPAGATRHVTLGSLLSLCRK